MKHGYLLAVAIVLMAAVSTAPIVFRVHDDWVAGKINPEHADLCAPLVERGFDPNCFGNIVVMANNTVRAVAQKSGPFELTPSEVATLLDSDKALEVVGPKNRDYYDRLKKRYQYEVLPR